jgi:choline dehydrogenase-like flavoprotein
MKRIVIVGSGATGVHFALSVLQKGYDVVILDVGYAKPPPVNPNDTFPDLKRNLSDPAAYFLGEHFESVVYPGSESEYYTKYYGFPPNKSYVFSKSPLEVAARGFEPLLSFARGGLAEAWTAGVYPFNDAELEEFPFGYEEIEPHYAEVSRRIGIAGAPDDLARFFPCHAHLRAPLRLDTHSALLLETYERQREQLRARLRCTLGRSRVATLTGQLDGRHECMYCGRCLWGCPVEAIYAPSITLRECLAYPNCTYVPNVYVSHFEYDANGRVQSLVAESLPERTPRRFEADTFLLAAGNLSSCKIYLDSVYRHSGEIVKLTGLMDNRQVLVPFVNLRMIGKPHDPLNYQYQQLAVGIESERPAEYVHGQITTLKSTLVHPIIQSMPLDLRTATFVFRNLHASMGVVNLSFPDRRRDTNYVTLEAEPGSGRSKLVIEYAPVATERTLVKTVVRRLKKLLWALGCVVPPGMVHMRPMGASVHYAGTLPMSTIPRPHTTSKYCQSHGFENLYVVDGAAIPFLPAKNLTFSLMANAVRVAETVF